MHETTASDHTSLTSPRPWLRPWLVVGLTAWLALGIALVDRANRQGLIQDPTISPYHAVGYAGLLVLAIYVIVTFFRGLRHRGWRKAFPPMYGGLGLGFLLILLWIVLDIVWRQTLGIREDSIEGGLAPPRLLLPAALIVIAAGPLRDALSRRGAHRDGGGSARDRQLVQWAGVVAVGLIGAAFTAVTLNPAKDLLNDYATNPGRDLAEIWSMAADGSGQTRLLPATETGVDYSLPVYSPDGARIAYTTWTNEGGAAQNFRNQDQTSAIWTMAADGTDRRLLVEGAPDQAWIPAWSPDGEWIAYTLSPQSPAAGAAAPEPNAAPGQVGPPSASVGASIWLVRPDGSDAHRISPEGVDALAAVWAPDADSLQVAYLSATLGGNTDIHVARITDQGLDEDRTIAADPANDWGPTFSRDGRSIVFTSNRTGNDEVWLAPIDGGAPRQLTDDGAGDWVPVFSPDGSRIAFASDRTGEPEVWTMAPDGSDLRNLTNHPGHFDGNWSVDWAPDGSRLVYGTGAFADASASGWVREDLASAESILFAIALAVVALLVVALGAPFGAFALVLALMTALPAVSTDAWRFVVAGAVAGLVVDGLVLVVRPRLRARVAAAALPAAGVLAIALTIGIGGSLAWSLTLLAGVTIAAALLGWGIAYAAEHLLPRAPVAAEVALEPEG